MYFKRIEIKNYGSIEDFNYSFRFDDNGNPIPCVLIGENGTGKTLVVTNLVDALVETKRQVYGASLSETVDNKYYKIGSKSYIKHGKEYSRVKVLFEHNSTDSYMIDIMALNGESYLRQYESSEIINKNKFKDDGYCKEIFNHLTRKEFDHFVTLYFPVDRYYFPQWFNSPNRKFAHNLYSTDISEPKSNIIKYDLLNEIHDWLIGVFLEKEVQQMSLPNSLDLPKDMRGQLLTFTVPTLMQRYVSQILSIIKGVYVNPIGNFSRINKALGFSSGKSFVNDVSQLSEGEMNLFCIFLTIIKDWEQVNGSESTIDKINGCVIIDEVDLGLHIDYAYRALPQLMKLFPKIQFILTSHSPFFLAGLKHEYGDNVDILNMPDGIKLTDLNTFGEMQKAQQLFNDSIKELQASYRFMEEQFIELQKSTGKIYVFTEGKTDVVFLEKAIEKLKITDLDIEIKAAAKGNGNGDEAVKSLLERLQDNNIANNLVIGIFDRDKKIEFKDANNIKKNLLESEYIKLGNNLFAFALPVPHERTDVNDISIEHYFTDEEIKTWTTTGHRLFLGNEFGENKFSLNDENKFFYDGKNTNIINTIKIIDYDCNTQVLDLAQRKNVLLSKSLFAENVKNNIDGFNKFDFSEFNKIFDVIREIKKQNGNQQ